MKFVSNVEYERLEELIEFECFKCLNLSLSIAYVKRNGANVESSVTIQIITLMLFYISRKIFTNIKNKIRACDEFKETVH